ncbi:Smr/MutS family protein [Stakelama marina]|uniref:Smr/MutS family protein n=1 Tax=Stakelama marina TaxID=2826939 RepID=A0A8T4IDA4_9SPHN|nr:Smr/MutS family protein [Stakelama marina]MBR0552072.1 Smr/MutS family protein [Stakelama marina]
MAGRRLSDEEAALWARVKAEVRPLHPRAERKQAAPFVSPPEPRVKKPAQRPLPMPPRTLAPVRKAAPQHATLDSGWDRRIGRGQVAPDTIIDLHGHSLASAHAMLDAGLDAAITRGERVLLLVTGKPPRAGSERPHARGAIRAAIHDWLAVSRHSSRIAAVRQAHPRHGGAGALYIVLRRTRTTASRKS